MAGDSNPQERPPLQRPVRPSRPAPLPNMHLHHPTPETRLPPLVVDVESESLEVLPQLPAVETIPGYHRASAPSSSRAGSSSRCQTTPAGSASEVICLDDTPGRPSASRSESSARKLRRLNNNAPVIVVDDEEDVVPVPRRLNRDHRPTAPPAPEVVPHALPSVRRLARADSNSSIRPFRSRARSTDRIRRYRATGPVMGATSDESPTSRNMPLLNTRASHIRVPVYSVPSSSAPRVGRSSQHAHAPVPPSNSATTSSRVAALLSTLGYARVTGRRSFSRSGSSRPLNIGVEVTTSNSRGRRSFEQEMLNSIMQHIAQSGGVPVGVEFRYFTDQSLDYESLVRLDEQLVRQRNAAPKNVINSLPEVVATEADVDIRCVVCMCDIEVGEKLRALPCSHKYHKKCIDEWFTYNGACPVDKKRICDFQPARPSGSS